MERDGVVNAKAEIFADAFGFDELPAATEAGAAPLFAAQDGSYRDQVLGSGLRVGIEAGIGFGWERWLGPDGVFVGMTGFGASAPAEDLYRHFGITAEAVTAAVKKRI